MGEATDLEPKLYRWLFMLVLALAAVGTLTGYIPNPFFEIPLGEYEPFVIFGLVLLGTGVFLNLLKVAFKVFLGNRIESEADIVALYQFTSYLVWFFVIIVGVFAILGVGGLFAGLGAGLLGAALIYVLQEPLLNIIAWTEILTQRLYRLGDRIEIKGVKGYVVDISIMNTTLREFENWMDSSSLTGRYVVMPNNIILSDFVFNYTRDTKFVNESLRVDFTYESDLKAAEAIMVRAAQEIMGDIMQKHLPEIRAKYEFREISEHTVESISDPIWRFADSSVNLEIRVFVPAHRRSRFKSKITRRIYELVAENPDVSFAYPHMELVPHDGGKFKVGK